MNKNHLTASARHPIAAAKYFAERMGLGRMDDREYLKFEYEYLLGVPLHLDPPKNYTEKINWMKLYDRNPMYTKLVDKYRVKQYVSDLVGEKYVIPLLKVWDSADEIDLSDLPDQFVLKVNHDSGGIVFCRDKKTFNLEEAKAFLKERLAHDYSQAGREWVYKNVPRCIFAEEYCEDLTDSNYKFYCFRGKMKAVHVAPYRDKYVDFFDRDFNHLDIYTRLYGPAPVTPEKPACFEEMRDLAEKLAGNFRAIRVDLYESHGKTYFGEFAFYPDNGFSPFLPEHWNEEFGSWIDLNEPYNR